MEKNLYQKINELKKNIHLFVKDETTSGYGAYKYVSGTQILKTIKDKMEELQLLFIPTSTTHRNWTTYDYQTTKGVEKTDFIVDGEITYQWINAENPEERQQVVFQYYGQQNDISKAFGSALTYSERYALLKCLGIPTDEDEPDRKNEDKKKFDKWNIVRENPYEDAIKENREDYINKLMDGTTMTKELLQKGIEKICGKKCKITEMSQNEFETLVLKLKSYREKSNE